VFSHNCTERYVQWLFKSDKLSSQRATIVTSDNCDTQKPRRAKIATSKNCDERKLRQVPSATSKTSKGTATGKTTVTNVERDKCHD
jgi:hypothetical protein